MKEHETAKFERFGSFFFMLLLGIGVGLPLILSFIMCIKERPFRFDVFLPLGLVFMLIAWITLIMLIGYNGMIGFISAYNPTKIQVFNADHYLTVQLARIGIGFLVLLMVGTILIMIVDKIFKVKN